jgi:DNA processing protein
VSERTGILQLMQTRGLGPRTLAQTLARLAREGRSPADLVAAPTDELTGHYGFKPDVARALGGGQRQAEQLEEELERQGVRVLIRGMADYPVRLTRLLGETAPPVLFVAGSLNLLEKKAVSFSGARGVSEEGVRLTQRLAQMLAQSGVNVVSGHANGVDLTAHCAALSAGGTTTLVLAEGILCFQGKPGLAELLDEGNHVVVSEFSPRQTWSVGNAMQRNRTICGLADAVVVIEAGETGGTYGAGQTALELRQPLFVVSYPAPPPSASGNAALIRQGGQALPSRPGCEPDATTLFQVLDQQAERGSSQRSVAEERTELVQGELFDRNGEEE